MGTGAMAASVSIDTINAAWQNPTPAGVAIDNSGDTVSARWGNGNNPSGYDFTPRSPLGFTLAENTPTVLGTFTHLNFPITGTTLESIQLNFSFGGSVLEDGEGNTFPQGILTASFGAIFDFIHEETTNTAPCGLLQQSGVPCDDIVTVSAQGGADEDILVDNTIFTFTLLGFSNDNGATFSETFVTTENGANSSDLYFDYKVSVIPLPAAGWLLLAGLGALGVAGRRRKSADRKSVV